MDFPLTMLMDEQACYDKLVQALHPRGLVCPRCRSSKLGVHRRCRAPVLDYQCGDCGRVFNAFTGSAVECTPRSPAQVMLILRGFSQGVSTAQLARELNVSRRHLLDLRHRWQGSALAAVDGEKPEPDAVTEADEMYQNAGGKGVPHADSDDPPRRRANKVRGHGTWEVDRPPVFGLVGRESGQVRLAVAKRSDRATLDLRGPLVQRHSRVGATVNTDEWAAYDKLPASGRRRVSVRHGRPYPEYARDDDGDGVREVHCNTMEGIWTGLRNFLRTFRGVSKKYLGGYVAMFQWSHNLKVITDACLRMLLTVVPSVGTIGGTRAESLMKKIDAD